jgi:hypothetical protein
VCCRARTSSSRERRLPAGLADEPALTGHLHLHQHASTKQGPFPHRRLCCPVGSSSTTTPSDAHPARSHFPAHHRLQVAALHPDSAARWAGEGLSSSRRHYLHVPRPLRRGIRHGCTFRIFTASMAFTLLLRARHPLVPAIRRGQVTTRQASLHVTDRTVARPRTGVLDAGLRPRPFPDDTASLLPGLLTATRTGLAPASDDELTSQSSTIHSINHQSLLDAQETDS